MRYEVYVAVEDLERAVAFYSRQFGEGPLTGTTNYAGYRLGFGVMSSAGYSMPVQRGNSAVPTLMVEDLDCIAIYLAVSDPRRSPTTVQSRRLRQHPLPLATRLVGPAQPRRK
jgi:hypothetical protein